MSRPTNRHAASRVELVDRLEKAVLEGMSYQREHKNNTVDIPVRSAEECMEALHIMICMFSAWALGASLDDNQVKALFALTRAAETKGS